MARILFLSPQPFYKWRGSPIRVAFTLQALAELGHEIDLLTFPFGADRDIPGVRVLRVPNLFRRRSVPIGPSFWKLAYDFLLLGAALRRARKGRYDVIHGVEEGGVIALPVARLAGAALVTEKHSDHASYAGRPLRNLVLRAYAATEKCAMRRADAVIGTGPGLVEQIRSIAPDRRVHLIPDAPSSLREADPDRTARIRARLLRGRDLGVVMYVGSFAVYQGMDLMFEAIPRTLERRPGTLFVVVGGTDAQIEQRRRQMAARGAAGAVEFLGRIAPDEMPDCLAAADVLLSPRIAGRNTPLKLLDYLKSGRAIVACDTDANRSILDAENALLAPPQPDAFADAIARALGDDALRARLAAKGLAMIRDVYNYGHLKSRLAACYAPLTSRPPLPAASSAPRS